MARRHRHMRLWATQELLGLPAAEDFIEHERVALGPVDCALCARSGRG